MRATPFNALLAASAVLLATSIPASAENGVSADKIVFGQAAALDGAASALGQGMKIGLEAAFAEINKAVEFDRDAARGKRLDIPSGTAVRLEPGDKRSVQLIDFGGAREVHGFNDEINGPLS